MCQMFAGQDPAVYEYETRSLRLNGQSTSIRLERAFWDVLTDIAEAEDLSVPLFISKLHSEVLELQWRGAEFHLASTLRRPGPSGPDGASGAGRADRGGVVVRYHPQPGRGA